jgi:inner membrane protein
LRGAGHAGLALLLFSPFSLIFRVIGADLDTIFMLCLFMIVFSFLPDFDFTLVIEHRGITHTLLFGLIIGFLLAILLGYSYSYLGWFMGFVTGFGGIVSHLFGDLFTYQPFKPFYPLSNKKIAYGFFKSSNKTVNKGLFILGVVLFTICFTLLRFL